MAPTKSQVEFYLGLCAQLIGDDPLGITSHKHLEKDLSTLQSRTFSEGLSFLTKTLPKLGKALDLGLVNGRFTPVEGFKSSKGRSTPAFLQAYFNLLFSEDGMLLEEAPPKVVRHLRQVLFFAYKLELPYQPELEDSVVQKFKEVDNALQFTEYDQHDGLLQLAGRISESVFKDFDPKDILPRHGPGAVATGERGESKWEFSRLYNQIHQFYPYYDYYIVGKGRELLDRRGWYKSLLRLEEGQAKVVLVPKDSRGPRLISAEPLEFQWIQQGLGRKMAAFLEADCPLTKAHVNFTNQEINRSHALRSSTTKEYATIDLQDASDRVSLELVRRVFKGTPLLLRALEATRSAETLLPNGEVVKLQKFAPMGSALCFPVEAFIFWVLCVSAIVREEHLPLKRAVRLVYVYGDDIIIPVKYANRCMQALESVGLVVNRNKSCMTGSFRESCGMDAFKGVEVTPVRLRKQFTDRRSDGTVYASYCSLANALEQRGYESAASLIWKRIENTYGKVPYGTSRSSFPCREVADPLIAEIKNLKLFKVRSNRRYQRLEFSLLTVLPVRHESSLDGWTRVLRDLVSPMLDDPSKVVLPRSTIIKRGWRAVS